MHMHHYYINAIEHTGCDVDPLGRSSFRWPAGTTAGPMSCRYLHGTHRQHKPRIQRRRSRLEAKIKQAYGPLSCHPIDFVYISIEIEGLARLAARGQTPVRPGYSHAQPAAATHIAPLL